MVDKDSFVCGSASLYISEILCIRETTYFRVSTAGLTCLRGVLVLSCLQDDILEPQTPVSLSEFIPPRRSLHLIVHIENVRRYSSERYFLQFLACHVAYHPEGGAPLVFSLSRSSTVIRAL